MLAMRLAVTTAVVLVLAAAPAWAAGGAALTVSPGSVSRGSTVTFTGAGCLHGGRNIVTLISKLFPGRAFGGAGAITTSADAHGHFTRKFATSMSTAPGRYTVTARCGGGNLGIAVHVRVS